MYSATLCLSEPKTIIQIDLMMLTLSERCTCTSCKLHWKYSFTTHRYSDGNCWCFLWEHLYLIHIPHYVWGSRIKRVTGDVGSGVEENSLWSKVKWNYSPTNLLREGVWISTSISSGTPQRPLLNGTIDRWECKHYFLFSISTPVISKL